MINLVHYVCEVYSTFKRRWHAMLMLFPCIIIGERASSWIWNHHCYVWEAPAFFKTDVLSQWGLG